MFKIKNKKLDFSIRRGMTLIEVMASIAIIGIMSAISIVSFTASKRSAELETAAEEVMAVLREAQNYSLTGKNLRAGCSSYTTVFTNASANFTLHNGLGTCELNQVYSLKNGVVIATIGSVIFEAPHATKSGISRILIRKNTSYYTVCVNTAGLIRKLSGNVACP